MSVRSSLSPSQQLQKCNAMHVTIAIAEKRLNQLKRELDREVTKLTPYELFKFNNRSMEVDQRLDR